jgi:hypothetical protein
MDPDWPGDVRASRTQLYPIPVWEFLEQNVLRRMPFLHNSVENLADIKAETLTSEVTHQDPVYQLMLIVI